MSENDNELIVRRILISEENWERLLKWAESQEIPVFFKEDNNLENTIDKYLGHAEKLLKSPVVLEFVKEWRDERKHKRLGNGDDDGDF